jgi:hypothetical protein
LIAGRAWAALKKKRREGITNWEGEGMANGECSSWNEPQRWKKGIEK